MKGTDRQIHYLKDSVSPAAAMSVDEDGLVSSLGGCWKCSHEQGGGESMHQSIFARAD